MTRIRLTLASSNILGTDGEPERQSFGQSGVDDLVLLRGDIVGNPVAGDGSRIGVHDREAGTRVPVARLADAADIEQVFVAGLDFDGQLVFIVEIGIGKLELVVVGPLRDFVDAPLVDAGDRLLAERDRNVGVPAKTDLGELIGEVVRGMVAVEDVAPVFRRVQRRVNDRGVVAGDPGPIGHGDQPRAFRIGQLLPGPVHREFRVRVKAGKLRFAVGRVFVVVAAHHCHPGKIAYQIKTFARFRVVADDVAE